MSYVKNMPLNKNPITEPLDEGTDQEQENDIKIYDEPITILKDNIIMRIYDNYKIIEVCKKLIIIYNNKDIFDVIQNNDQAEQKIKELIAKQDD